MKELVKVVEVKSIEKMVALEIIGRDIVIDGKFYDILNSEEKARGYEETVIKAESLTRIDVEETTVNSLEEARKAMKEDEDLNPMFYFLKPEKLNQREAAISYTTISEVTLKDGREVDRKIIEILHATEEAKKELAKYIDNRDFFLKYHTLKKNTGYEIEINALEALESTYRAIDWESGDNRFNFNIMFTAVRTVDIMTSGIENNIVYEITDYTQAIREVFLLKEGNEAKDIKAILENWRKRADNR